MKTLLRIAAAGEFATGLLLLAYPPLVISLLFAAEISGAGISISRIAGIALMALAVACWPNGNTDRAFAGMVTYGVLATVYMIVVGATGMHGPLLWPAVLAHAALSVLLIRARSASR
ncbi:MAG TPA: hypothetical protein VE783_06350 [Candidatus Limnocylindrales bacterium]|nr:hypothetical protein [Candidatus Limnocylindrales bacterium]